MEKIKSTFTFRKLTGILTFIAILGIVCLFQIVQAGFSVDVFQDPDFYIRLVYRALLIPLVFFAVTNTRYDSYLRRDKVVKAKERYKKAVKMKDVSFQDFLDYYNRNTKIEAWKLKIDTKINKLSRKLEKGHFIKRRTKKLEYLKSLKEDDYIKENFDYLNCKWTKLYTGDFTLEDSIAGSQRKVRSTFNSDMAKNSLKKMSSYFLMALALGIVSTNFALDTVQTSAFWFNMCVDISIVIKRAIDAELQMDSNIDENFTNIYIYKTEVMQEYSQWCITHNIEESKAHKILDVIEQNNQEKKE